MNSRCSCGGGENCTGTTGGVDVVAGDDFNGSVNLLSSDAGSDLTRSIFGFVSILSLTLSSLTLLAAPSIFRFFEAATFVVEALDFSRGAA